jgi:GDP-D-mannose 3', 5'-epimerase
VIEAKTSGKHEIVIWGDGSRTINLGSSEMVSINQLVDIVEDIAKIKLKRIYDLDAPKGVMGRNSDNTLMDR